MGKMEATALTDYPWFYCSFCGEAIDVVRESHVVHMRNPSNSSTVKVGNMELNTTIVAYECQKCYHKDSERAMTAYEQIRIPI